MMRALVRLVSRPDPIKVKEKFTKLRADYRYAQQILVRNEKIPSVSIVSSFSCT